MNANNKTAKTADNAAAAASKTADKAGDTASDIAAKTPKATKGGGLNRSGMGLRNAVEFPSLWKKAGAVSAALVLLALGALLFRGLNLGIEFEGGQSWEFDAGDATTDDIRGVMADFGLSDARIQQFGESQVRVRAEIPDADIGRLDEIRGALAAEAGIGSEDVSPSAVGASWGDEITGTMWRALMVFGVVIFLYITIRLEWKMAVGALIAVFHDIVITVGIYALFQFEVTAATVIAFLTILGYSLYDTLVVFDKIRDNEGRVQTSSKLTYTSLVSHSLNQVIMRSINTTITSVLPVLAVLIIGRFILGAITLQEFAIALLVGLLVGTYSSLFVATPIVAWLKEREPANIERRERLGGEDTSTAAVASILAEADRSRDVRAQARSETRRITGTSASKNEPKGRAAGAVTKSKVQKGSEDRTTRGVTAKSRNKADGVAEKTAGSAGDTAATGDTPAIPPRPRKKKRK